MKPFRLFTSTMRYFASNSKNLVDFTPKVEAEVMPKVASHIGRPTIRQTKLREEYSEKYDRTGNWQGMTKHDDWSRDIPLMTTHDAVREAQRCLKCTDAPCQKGCSTSIDIKSFIYNIEKQNWYGAAKVILSDNPLGLSCGLLCPISELCAKNCNVSETEQGAIKINRLQELAVRLLKEMSVKQILDPNLDVTKNVARNEPIALIGAGAASISCASFLARLGYQNLDVYESKSQGGGLIRSEIPVNRAPKNELDFEVELMKQLGVRVHFNSKVGEDVPVESLKGKAAIFLGCGLPNPKTALGKAIYEEDNVWHSKSFLGQVSQATKEKCGRLPKLKGHVIVLGIGDTALDCARSAFRCGAERVSVFFRRGWQDFRANDEIFDPAKQEGINFIPYSDPKQLFKNEKGEYYALEFENNLPTQNDPQNLKYKGTGHKTIVSFDHLITAFGSELQLDQLTVVNKRSDKIQINDRQEVTSGVPLFFTQGKPFAFNSFPKLFAGGDSVGIANLVDASNDGKTAAWFIHKHLQEKMHQKVSEVPQLPGFFTEIDKVNLETEILGVKFSNPFGLASAPPCTSYPMIKRAFKEGWGFAVIKTFCLDKDAITNISPRIYKSTSDPLKQDPGFANIELISEKSAAYWIQGSKQLKKEFPDHVLIGSIMAGYKEKDWIELTTMASEGSFDFLELNLSCPHGMTELGMGRACGENPEMVKNIAKWVTSVAKVPVIIKITPNYGEASHIAQAALDGGAKAVTLTNTFPTLMDPDPLGTPWPAVGADNKVTYGGGCGSMLRPIALRKTTEVSKSVPIEIFGSGGIIQGDHAISFMRYGAKALQICSAVQDQDFATVIYDLTTSVKAHLYLAGQQHMIEKGWKGQFPPRIIPDTASQQQPSPKSTSDQRPALEIVHSGLHHIEEIAHMPREQFLVPQIHQDKCLKCGRCYLACADSGYQAIQFTGFTSFPEIIEEFCTGCALCHSVCPVAGSMSMVPRTTDLHIQRGLELTNPPANLFYTIPGTKTQKK